jgi:hypothetical protein
MYTPGDIIDLSTNTEIKLGLVIYADVNFIKYLTITPDVGIKKPNSGIYHLRTEKVLLDKKPNVKLDVHIDVTHITEGTFKKCGKLKNNKELIEIMSYVNGYKDYSKLVNNNYYSIGGPILRK